MNPKLQCLVLGVASARNTPRLQRFLFTTHASFTVICILMRVSVFLRGFQEGLLPLFFGHIFIVKNACVIPTLNKDPLSNLITP